jgi:hypothetical protein
MTESTKGGPLRVDRNENCASIQNFCDRIKLYKKGKSVPLPVLAIRREPLFVLSVIGGCFTLRMMRRAAAVLKPAARMGGGRRAQRTLGLAPPACLLARGPQCGMSPPLFIRRSARARWPTQRRVALRRRAGAPALVPGVLRGMPLNRVIMGIKPSNDGVRRCIKGEEVDCLFLLRIKSSY